MLYRFFRYPLFILYICFYRRIYLIDSKKIRQDKPVIFTSNHSNGFLDPLMIAVFQWRHIWFWVGASEIGSGIKGFIMRTCHSLPIYRQKEGKENMHKNEQTFKESREMLYKGDTLYLAPEGKCIIHKKLLPLKTGCARLAFKMMEEKDWKIDLKILCTGVNYTYHDRFRSEVYIKFGKTISIQDYKELYEQDNFAAIKKVTEDIRTGITEEMVYVEEEDEVLTEKMLVLGRNNVSRGAFPIISNNSAVLEIEQKIANYIGKLDTTQKQQLETQVDTYNQTLVKYNTNDYGIAGKNTRNIAWLLLGFPIWLVGSLLGKLPQILSKKLTLKVVPYPEFIASFGITIAFFIWAVYGLLLIGVGSIWLGWEAAVLPFLAVGLQTYGYHYEDYFQDWKLLQQHKKASNSSELKTMRAKLPVIGE
jgi:1-acyl-sn-glycerol-3-phosphate acyltransferase